MTRSPISAALPWPLTLALGLVLLAGARGVSQAPSSMDTEGADTFEEDVRTARVRRLARC